MNPVTRIAAFFALSLLAQAAPAGGDAWPFHVVSFEQGWFSQATFELEAVLTEDTPATPLFGCSRITVYSRFARPSFFRSHPPGVTRQSHIEAVNQLRRANSNSEVVLFGVLGTGLVPASEHGACAFRSRALHQVETHKGTAILSLHNAL